MMKKIILSTFILGSFGFYVLSQSQGASSAVFNAPQSAVVATVATKNSKIIPSVKKTTPTLAYNPTPAPAPKKTGIYNDGTYTGSSENAYYGNVQVQVTIANGMISDVQFLDYPQDRNTSRRINSQAMPILTREAISVQSANVDRVSGASDTSAAFKQSLASALAQA
jgi:uncharacterized protein with FMN-binding domain